MKRFTVCCLLLASAVLPAHAHFIWIVPDGAAKAKVVFSDNLDADEGVPIEKIAATKLLVRDSAGKAAVLDWKKGEACYLVALPEKAPAVVGGTCLYGVIQRGEGKPFLLAYYPKLIQGDVQAAKKWDQLPFEIVSLGAGRFQAIFGGKPAADAEVIVMAPNDDKETLKADAAGEFKIRAKAAGLYGIRARHIESKAGQHEGKKYDEARHYATLVFRMGAPAK